MILQISIFVLLIHPMGCSGENCKSSTFTKVRKIEFSFPEAKVQFASQKILFLENVAEIIMAWEILPCFSLKMSDFESVRGSKQREMNAERRTLLDVSWMALSHSFQTICRELYWILPADRIESWGMEKPSCYFSPPVMSIKRFRHLEMSTVAFNQQ